MRQIYIILLFLCFSAGGALFGQQSPRFAHFLFNESAFNPAMAGVNKTEVFLFHRQQWAGLDDGSFTSQLIGAGIRPFGLMSRIGLGVLLNVDQAHIIKNGNYGLSFAYRILDGEQTPHTLSIGVLGGVISNSLSYESAQINNPFDIALFDRAVNDMVFNYGMGIAYKGPIGDKGTLMVSAASNQSANDLMFDNPETGFLYGLKRNLIANARFAYAINEKISVEPGVLYRRMFVNSDLKDDIVVGVRGNFMETVSAGVTYATASNSVGVVLGISLGKAKTSGAFEMPMGTGADLGMTYELGVVVRPTRLQREEEEEVVADTNTPATAPVANPTKKVEKEIKGEITRARLIRQLQEVGDRPFNVEIEVEKNKRNTVVYYRFVNLFSAYAGVSKVENFVNHLNELNKEWADMGYKIRHTLLTSKTYENEAIMNAVIDMKYGGEFGSVNGVPYQYNRGAASISLGDDQLTIKEREFLKLFRFVQALRSNTDQIDISILSNQSVFETVIEFRLEK